MARKLPRFEPVGISEGHALWRKYRGNADVERMLLEIAQAREVMQEIGDYFGCCTRCGLRRISVNWWLWRKSVYCSMSKRCDSERSQA
jgi:hypothetical protein